MQKVKFIKTKKAFYINIPLSGQMLVELVMAIGIAAIILPALLTGLVTSRQGRPQQQQNIQATELFKETATAVRAIRDTNWSSFAVNGTYHPVIVSNAWTFATGSATVNGFTQQVVINDVHRDSSGNIVSSGGTVDPSTKQVVITVSWAQPQVTTLSSTDYLTRTTNLTHAETAATDFNAGTLVNTQVTNTSGGEVELGNDNNAKWCSPAFSSATIDLPDGPPVAVAATGSAVSNSIPDDAFVAVAPTASTSTKLAYVNVTADSVYPAPPVPSLVGTFTLDPAKYSNASLVPSGIGITNSFKTTDVKYYTSSGGNLYALLGTDMPDHEVIVVQIKSGGSLSWQDSTNHIFKYWTYFNTRQYQGDTRSTPNQDQSPFGYGAEGLTILGNRGYVDSGGYLYTFDLSNIDSKSPSSGLDEVGCRIQLDGIECQPGSGTDLKYSAGQTGTTWSTTAAPAHLDCTDGGNVELNADHQMSGVTVSGNNYIYVAVGAGTNPEMDIVNATSVPTSTSTPKINANSCGTTSGNSGWKVVGSLDFDTKSNTEEAANSVYAKTDGTRAYMSSNGGVDSNNDGLPDSDQFYVIDTTTKTSPRFLSSSSSTQGSVATSGYYNGTGSNLYLYPRRALTVQNGARAIIVGVDGNASDNNQAQQYQVLDLSTEASPTYCGGLNFAAGFNDLTSVTEADGDNFVYMVANTPDKQLKIIQGGPDNAIYDASGTFESQTFDTASVDGSTLNRAFNRILSNISQPTNTTIKLQTAVAPAINNSCSGVSFNYVGPDGTASSYFTVSGSTIAGIIPLGDYLTTYENPGRCFRYKVFLSTLDQTLTPVLYDTTVNYSQ